MEKNGAGAARVAVGDTECNGSTLRTATPRPLAPLNGQCQLPGQCKLIVRNLSFYIYTLYASYFTVSVNEDVHRRHTAAWCMVGTSGPL